MRFRTCTSVVALAASLIAAPTIAVAQDTNAGQTSGLDVIVVTAQKRETGLQDTALAVAAMSGANLEASNIVSFEDLASSVPSLSFTAGTPFDQEFNIRGVTNTRLDAPTSDQSIGIFLDEVFVGRSGLLNTDFYDIERVEVIRGPQGVLLGRNVVGGAISIITRKPEFEQSASLRMGYGNYNSATADGFVTGEVAPNVAGRFSFRVQDRAGYNKDVNHNRDLDDLRSFQFRGQLLFAPDDSDTEVRFIADYLNDETSGMHSVAVPNPTGPAGPRPWSTSRVLIAAASPHGLGIRDGIPGYPTFAGDTEPSPTFGERESWGATLTVETGVFDNVIFNSITGYRHGTGSNHYSQTGFEPGFPVAGVSPLAFDEFVYEDETISQFTQELRLSSNYEDGRFDWILGAYYQNGEIEKIDRFWGANPAGIGVLSGEAHWNNTGDATSYAVFGQVGLQVSDTVRVTGGVRWSHDDKSGVAQGTAIVNGDEFFPNDPTALTPLAGGFAEGTGFVGPYDNSWEEVTPQVTVDWSPTDNAFFYATWSKGYKGGGFEDTVANAAAAAISYDPETVINIEVGAKLDFWDNRARLNLAAFSMDYQNLQVTQTDAGCLCNITDNAADAEISGMEAEFLVRATDRLLVWASGSVLDTEYVDFVDSLGRDNSGNFLQRTPDYQVNVGAELTADLGAWNDALRFRINYAKQGELFWLPDNLTWEEGYGLLDGRISLQPEGRNWRVSVWGRNLTDELYRVNVIPFFGDEVSRLGTPRTYGIELGVDF